MKPIVLLDCDGVLADFLTPAWRIACHVTNKKLSQESLDRWDVARFFEMTPKEETTFYREVKEPGFHDKIYPYPGVTEAMRLLRELAEVHVLTSPMHGPSWCYDRWRWLERHLGVKPREVTHSHRKELVRGDVLVDDKMETVVAWQEAHPQGKAFLWAQHYNYNLGINEKNVRRTRDWGVVTRELARRLGAMDPV